MVRVAISFLMLALLNSFKTTAQPGFKEIRDTMVSNITLKILPQNFYNQHVGFFCKKEFQLQKLTNLPLFLRLGSKEYVDRLEQKPGGEWSMVNGEWRFSLPSGTPSAGGERYREKQ